MTGSHCCGLCPGSARRNIPSVPSPHCGRAPGDEATLRARTDMSRRPPQPLRPVPQQVTNHHPVEEVALSKQHVADALRTSQRGSAVGLSGATVEFYTLLLDDDGALEVFTFVVNVAARAQAPPVAMDALALSRSTALRKPQGGVRGIATGCIPSLRFACSSASLRPGRRPVRFSSHR